MKTKAGSAVHPTALVAYENGRRFGEWNFVVAPSGGWSRGGSTIDAGDPPITIPDYGQNPAMGWHNNNGAGIGLALFRKIANDFSLPDAGDYEDAHTVHLRVNHSNAVLGDAYCLAPATACHTSPAVNGYTVLATNGDIPRMVIAKISGGSLSPLRLVARKVIPGDVISISYRWDSVNSWAELAMLHNGVPVESQPGDFTQLDVSSPYEIGAVSNGKFGIFGNDSRAISASASVPELCHEWWVTAGWVSYADPPSLSQKAAGLRMLIMGRQQFTDSTEPTIRKAVSGALLSASWSHDRIGGNRDLAAEFKLPEVSGSEHVDAKSFSDPTHDDWQSSHWIGGEVVLEHHHKDFSMDQAAPSSADAVWRGRVNDVEVNDKGVVSVRAEGLVADLDNLFVSQTFENRPIREILVAIIQNVGKGSSTGGFDTYVRYNPGKIVGLSTVMDRRIDVEFQWESARSAIERVFEFLPGDMVWGVDRDGDFYVQPETDYYSSDGSGVGIQHFEVDNQAVRFQRSLDFSRIRTSYVVLGEDQDDGTRITGTAQCGRARQLFGLRGAVTEESDVADSGTASRLAAVRLKPLTIPQLTGRLTVSRPIREERDLSQLLAGAAGPPRVAVTDRRSPVSISSPTDEMGIDDYTSTEYTLRRFGDSTAYACNDKGSSGASVVLPSVTLEQTLNTQWLLHIVVNNAFLHPGVSGDSCFIFGRPSTAADDQGWGSLWWKHDGGTDGHLEWRYETSGSTSRVLDTGITLNPIGVGNKTVHFTVWRDATSFRFYDGNTQTGTDGGSFASDILANGSWPWRAFDHGNSNLPATQIDGDAKIDQMWLIDTFEVERMFGGVTGLIAAANGNPLPRGRSAGLIRYLPMQEPAGAATRSLASWLDDGLSDPQVALATWTRSEAAGTGDGSKLSNGARGLLLGKEKRWGGPLIFTAESVDYELDGSTGVLTRDFTLGELPPDAFTTLAVMRQEIVRLQEKGRRVS